MSEVTNKLLDNAKYQYALYNAAKDAFGKSYRKDLLERMAQHGVTPKSRFFLHLKGGPVDYVLEDVWAVVVEWSGEPTASANILCYKVLKSGKVGKTPFYLNEDHIKHMNVALSPMRSRDRP